MLGQHPFRTGLLTIGMPEILYRWLLDLNLDETSFDHSTFSPNSERLLAHEVSQRFFDAV